MVNMEEIVIETAESLSEAVAFANRQFGLDFLQFQSKVYANSDLGKTYTIRSDGRIAGMLSVYPTEYGQMRYLSVGTVCTAPEFRGQGMMSTLFQYLEHHVFPNYDLITLCGKRTRYERFGFAKAMTFPEYWFYSHGQGALRLTIALGSDCALLYDLWKTYGNGVQRTPEGMLEILRSAGHEVYLLTDGVGYGYISWKPAKRLITEYCGPWPVQTVIDSVAALAGDGKIGIIGRYNRHDDVLLHSCDSYLIRNHGNIRIPNMEVEDVYHLFGYGGGEAKQLLPTSLFFLDGI